MLTEIEPITEKEEILQNNADYTLFSWSKQAGLNPIAVKVAKGFIYTTMTTNAILIFHQA